MFASLKLIHTPRLLQLNLLRNTERGEKGRAEWNWQLKAAPESICEEGWRISDDCLQWRQKLRSAGANRTEHAADSGRNASKWNHSDGRGRKKKESCHVQKLMFGLAEQNISHISIFIYSKMSLRRESSTSVGTLNILCVYLHLSQAASWVLGPIPFLIFTPWPLELRHNGQ